MNNNEKIMKALIESKRVVEKASLSEIKVAIYSADSNNITFEEFKEYVNEYASIDDKTYSKIRNILGNNFNELTEEEIVYIGDEDEEYVTTVVIDNTNSVEKYYEDGSGMDYTLVELRKGKVGTFVRLCFGGYNSVYYK